MSGTASDIVTIAGAAGFAARQDGREVHIGIAGIVAACATSTGDQKVIAPECVHAIRWRRQEERQARDDGSYDKVRAGSNDTEDAVQ